MGEGLIKVKVNFPRWKARPYWWSRRRTVYGHNVLWPVILTLPHPNPLVSAWDFRLLDDGRTLLIVVEFREGHRWRDDRLAILVDSPDAVEPRLFKVFEDRIEATLRFISPVDLQQTDGRIKLVVRKTTLSTPRSTH